MNSEADPTPEPPPWLRHLAKHLAADIEEDRKYTWGDVDEDLLASYVAGLCTPDEKRRVGKAMRDNSEMRECVTLARRAVYGRQPAFRLIAARLTPLAAAAVILLAVTLGYLAYHRRPGVERRPELAGDQLSPNQLSGFQARIAVLESQLAELQAAGSRPNADRRFILTRQREVRADARQLTAESGNRLSPRLEESLLEGRAGEKIGMIIPHYFFTMDAADQAAWKRIVSLAGPNLPVKIVNTRPYGKEARPTEAYLKGYAEALNLAREHGVEVFAYVNCDGGLKDLDRAKEEIRNWHELQGGRIRGMYFDNQPMNDDHRVGYFAELFGYTRSLAPNWQIITATDSQCSEAYGKIDDKSIICYKTEGAFPRFKGWEKPYGSERFAAIVYKTDQLEETALRRTAAVFGWVFVTSPSEKIDPHKHLPDYLEKEAEYLRSINQRRNEQPPPARSPSKDTRPA